MNLQQEGFETAGGGQGELWESNSRVIGIANSFVPGQVVRTDLETPELLVFGTPIDANLCLVRGSRCTIWYDAELIKN